MKPKNHTENAKQKNGELTMTNLNDNHTIPFKTRFSTKLRKGIINSEPSKTKQSFQEESDMNNILKKYAATGSLPTNLRENPRYGDFSTINDYQTSINIVLNAQEQFAGLPALARERFNNDPAQFLDFMSKSENIDEMAKLGLTIPKSIQDEPIVPLKKKAPPGGTPEA